MPGIRQILGDRHDCTLDLHPLRPGKSLVVAVRRDGGTQADTEGWIFQAPNWWLIGPRRHSLVNEAQKSKIAAQLRRMWTMVLLAIIALIAIGLPLSKSLIGDKHPIAMLGAFVFCGAVAGMMVSAYTIRRLRPLIAGLELTTQRITQREAMLGRRGSFRARASPSSDCCHSRCWRCSC
jgi:hypothetical protein